MKCPLMCIAAFHTGYGIGSTETDCLKEECAWWSKPYEMCDVNILTQKLYELVEAVKNVEKKMPTPWSL